MICCSLDSQSNVPGVGLEGRPCACVLSKSDSCYLSIGYAAMAVFSAFAIRHFASMYSERNPVNGLKHTNQGWMDVEDESFHRITKKSVCVCVCLVAHRKISTL